MLEALNLTYNALLPQRDDAILNPEAPTSHHVGEHHVSRQAVTHNRNLRGIGHACFWILLEILHDLATAAWFLHGMVKNSDACGGFYSSGKLGFRVPTACAGGVGDDKESTTGIVLLERLKVSLITIV